MKSIFRLAIFFLLVLCLQCSKSWGKFWDLGTTSIVYSANFGSQSTGFYSGNALWNDYIKNDGTALSVVHVSPQFTTPTSSASAGQTTRLNATNTACAASQTGGYSTCIHAGMMRGFTLGTSKTDCSKISVTDSLSAFTWICDATASPVRIVSVGLRDGKYLSDLIDFNSVAFRSISVTVNIDGQVFTSTPSVWWANTVTNLVTASYGVQSTIYLVQSSPGFVGAAINQADKTALLIKTGIKMATAASSTGVVDNNSRHFTWYEGSIDLSGSLTTSIGFKTGTGAFVVTANLAVTNASITASSAVQFSGKNGYNRDIRYANATIASQVSYELATGGDANLLNGLIATNDEFSMQLKSTNNVILNFTSGNSANASNVNVDFQTGNSNNAMINVSSGNNGTTGAIGAIRTSLGSNNTIMNLGIANTPNPGYSGAGATGTQIINVASHTMISPPFLVSASTFTYITGTMRLSALSCTSAAPDSGILTGTCAPQNASDFTITSSALNPAATFVGKVTTDDPQNSSDGNGVVGYAVGNDWLNFANRLRGYGMENAAAFPGAPLQGRCIMPSPNCRIWDWSLRAGDTEYRNQLAIPTGSNTASHKWSAASQINCTQPGAVWNSTGTCQYPPFTGGAATCSTWTGGVTTNAACLTTFLRNAYEIIDDGIGNDNGLCESNEACIYTPNIASYQGHGNLTCIRGPADLGCATAFTNGTISNVVLYQYATNGY